MAKEKTKGIKYTKLISNIKVMETIFMPCLTDIEEDRIKSSVRKSAHRFGYVVTMRRLYNSGVIQVIREK
jgi:hypothetical protein